MKKAILYKEWIKTRLYFPISLAISLAFIVFLILRLQRVAHFKGVEHIWNIMLSHDVIFIELLNFVPVVLGSLLAIVQFIPEMQQKRLKLTLHLPFNQQKMILIMLSVGFGEILLIYLVNYSVLYTYLQSILAPELTERILITSLPWYICGITIYLLTAWICLEPTWKRRFVNLFLSCGIIRIFFMNDVPQSYDSFLFALSIFTLSCLFLPLLSVDRFKMGKQDLS